MARNHNLLAASQAYVQYQELDPASQNPNGRLQALALTATRLMQFPEYLMATRTLKRERARRGVPDAVPLDIFAEVLKADLEQQRDALVPLYDPTGDRLLQDFDEATHRGDLARARTVYTQLEGTKELESAYAAAVRRILADSDDTRYRD